MHALCRGPGEGPLPGVGELHPPSRRTLADSGHRNGGRRCCVRTGGSQTWLLPQTLNRAAAEVPRLWASHRVVKVLALGLFFSGRACVYGCRGDFSWTPADHPPLSSARKQKKGALGRFAGPCRKKPGQARRGAQGGMAAPGYLNASGKGDRVAECPLRTFPVFLRQRDTAKGKKCL